MIYLWFYSILLLEYIQSQQNQSTWSYAINNEIYSVPLLCLLSRLITSALSSILSKLSLGKTILNLGS